MGPGPARGHDPAMVSARPAGARAVRPEAPAGDAVAEESVRPWAALWVAARVAALAVAAGLLALGGLTGFEAALVAVGTALTAGWTPVLLVVRSAGRLRAACAVDAGAVLALVLASGDWRSPFYLLWLTTLAVPAVGLRRRPAGLLAAAAVLSFLVVAYAGGPEPGTLDATSSETFAVHLALPALVVGGLAYAGDVLRRLERERARSAALALEAERRRIAWELHDSAKQRVHAAHLLLTSLPEGSAADPRIARSVVELESAGAEMDTTLAGLRSPLAGRPLHEAIAERAAELTVAGGPPVEVRGCSPDLPEPLATHAYRIGVEAVTNAVRHAGAGRIEVTVGARGDHVVLDVCDDGDGLPDGPPRRGAGLLAMHSRAASVGGRLHLGPGPHGRGTRVHLEIPHRNGADP